jgi:hypothetical protein
MNKTKKTISILIIIILSFIILFVCLYSFKEAKRLATDQAITDKNLADLESAKQKMDLENKRLSELRGKSYAMQVSQEQYLKIKSLVDKTNIFFRDADSLHPKIQIKINNKTLEDKINAKRLKINELLLTWDENNKRFLETDQALINKIKLSLKYIESYVEEIQTIVFDLSTKDSELSNEQINLYKNVITNSVSEIKQIITTVNQAETVMMGSTENGSNVNSDEITRQIEIVKQAENTVTNLENIINNTATTTPPTPPQNSSVSTTTGTKVDRRPRIVNPEPAIIYQQNPTPYKNTGVDVNTSGQMSPLQGW